MGEEGFCCYALQLTLRGEGQVGKKGVVCYVFFMDPENFRTPK